MELELSLETGELLKNGYRINLPDQASQILKMLLERPGELITREQIQAKLWPDGTVVDFDHAINSSIRRIRGALNDSAEQPRYIETLSKRGYRFIFPAELNVNGQDGQQHLRPTKRLHVTSISVACAAIIIAAMTYLSRYLQTFTDRRITSIAVLPFVNATHDPSADYLSDGISEEIINRLSAAHDLKVIARTSAFQFRGENVDPQKAGRTLGVEAVLTGSTRKRDEFVSVQTELVRVSDRSELWGEQYQRDMADLQDVQRTIAAEIAAKLRLRLSETDEKRLTKRFTDNTQAYEAYLKAAHASSASEQENLLQNAIAKDPNFALAYLGLACYYGGAGMTRARSGREAFVKQKAAAMKALELNDSLAEAHLSLANALLTLDWDWGRKGVEASARVERDWRARGLQLLSGPCWKDARSTRRSAPRVGTRSAFGGSPQLSRDALFLCSPV